MKFRIQNGLLLTSIIILISYVVSCLPESKFSMDSVSPKTNSKNVPVNAVIKIVFISENKIAKSSLSADRYTLAKITKKEDKKDDSTSGSKDQSSTASGTDQTNQNNSSKTSQTQSTPVKGKIVSEEKIVPVDTKNGQESRVQTTVYFIPLPADEKSVSPLEPNANYQFTISSLKDTKQPDPNVFQGSIINFNTDDSSFEFSSDVRLQNQITPSESTSIIAPDQWFVFQLDGPVNPLLLKKYSKVEKTMTGDITQFLNTANSNSAKSLTKKQAGRQNSGVADQSAGHDRIKNDLYQKRRDQIEKRLEVLNAKTDVTASDLDEADKLLAEDDSINNKMLGIDTASTVSTENSGAKSGTKNSGLTQLNPPQSNGFVLYFLENFSDTENEFITLNYDKVAISSNFNPAGVYDLTLSALSLDGGNAIKEIDYIQPSSGEKSDKTVISNLTAVNFSESDK